jgi:hypothetical protein
MSKVYIHIALFGFWVCTYYIGFFGFQGSVPAGKDCAMAGMLATACTILLYVCIGEEK